jgi:cytochrome c-type biogenesis protein CcmH/NrfF
MSRARRLALALTALAALGAPTAALAAVQRTTLYAVESQVMCPTCGIPLLEAQSPQADEEKLYIQGLVNSGETMGQIKAKLVQAYGDEVLALPPASGFNAAVYIVPIAVVAALLALVAVLLPRWRRRRRQEPSAAATSAALSAADAARLDADLARFDS